MTRQTAKFCLNCMGALTLSSALLGQSCTITSPTASQLIQTAAPFQLTLAVSNAPTAYRAVWTVDYWRWAQGFNADQHQTPVDSSEVWTGTPFGVTWYTGLLGDGQHTASAIIYDIFGTQLAGCSQSFKVNLEGMANQCVNSLPNNAGSGSSCPGSPLTTASGTGKFGVLSKVPGTNISINGMTGSGNYNNPLYPACGFNGATTQSGGWQIPNLVTTCYPNGVNLIVAGANPQNAGDPYVVTQTFTSANIGGNNVTVTNHSFQIGNAAVLSTTGALPGGLAAGCSYYWATSATNPSHTVGLSVSGGAITLTLSSACGSLSGTVPVYLLNVESTNQTTGQANCDGYYANATISSTTVTIPAPTNCPNGATATQDLEVDVNPFFLQYVDANTVSFSATPGGSTIAITSGGSGTDTITTRVRSPWWTSSGSNGYPARPAVDYVKTGGSANTYSLVTFSNGSSPMQIQVPWWETHGWAGKSGDTDCPLGIFNTDGTLTATGTGGITCARFTYTLTQDGGNTGGISINTSTGAISYANTSAWSNPSAPNIQAYVDVSCSTCGPGGIALPTVRVYHYNHGNSQASVTFPHHTTCGILATSFTTGNCHSFYPLSAWQVNAAGSPPAWIGPALTRANMNSILWGFTYTTNLTNPAAVSCPSWPDATMSNFVSFANTNHINMEYDLYSIWFNLGYNTTSLAAILNNIGYNRQSCLQSLVSYLVGLGNVWRFFNDDEVSNIVGSFLEPNPAIGGANWTNATTSAGVITFNVANLTSMTAWNQSTGNGNAIQITGLTTNSACNGWYLLTSVSSSTLTAPTPAGCGNGITINSSSDPSAKMNLPFPALAKSGTNLQQNAGPLPGNLSATEQLWDSNLTSIVVSGSTGTIHWTGHGISSTNTPAIRLYCYACAHTNLNFFGIPTVTDANTLTITWSARTGGSAPVAGTYNSSTDGSGFYITVDPNWGANPLGQFYSVVDGVANHPIRSWSMLGSLFGSSASVYSYMGNPANTDSAWLYVPASPGSAGNPTGYDGTIRQWAFFSESSSGINSRAFQLQPRTMLYGGGYIGGGNIIDYCRSFQFNPACDKPAQLAPYRRESMVAQMMGAKMIGVSGLRLYNFYQDTGSGYAKLCCGWGNSGGWGTGASMSPYTSPTQWAAMAQVDALLTMRQNTELQPETNKPYLGPYFKTDAHLSSTYGNETSLLCAADTYPLSVTLPLNPISGGSTLLYSTDGYSTRINSVAGNPSSVTISSPCQSPGSAKVYVSMPPGYTPLDNITFAPPPTLPFGASKFLIQVGYYPEDMRSDPVTDCTAACTIGIDHHDINAWYRVIYADSNKLPLSIGDPTRIPTQGLN